MRPPEALERSHIRRWRAGFDVVMAIRANGECWETNMTETETEAGWYKFSPGQRVQPSDLGREVNPVPAPGVVTFVDGFLLAVRSDDCNEDFVYKARLWEPEDVILRVEGALRLMGSARTPDPDWQRRVWSQIEANARANARAADDDTARRR